MNAKVKLEILPHDSGGGFRYKIAVEDLNGTPTIGINDFSVAIRVEDWSRIAEAVDDAIVLWRKNAGFRDIPLPFSRNRYGRRS